MEDYEEETDPPIMLQQNDAYSTQVQLQNVASSSENHQQQLQYVPNSILHNVNSCMYWVK